MVLSCIYTRHSFSTISKKLLLIILISGLILSNVKCTKTSRLAKVSCLWKVVDYCTSWFREVTLENRIEI